MSQETFSWLNNFTLIGFTEKRGHAWHYRESEQGAEPNHYAGPIPVEDVERRLFSWEPVDAELYVRNGGSFVSISGRKATVRSDNGDVLGIHGAGWTHHTYRKTLITTAREIVSGTELGLGSAGLLRNGAQAWCQYELAESVVSSADFAVRPFLTAFDSCDGSLAQGYMTGAQAVVCDNTLSAAMLSADTSYKVKHTRNSGLRLAAARDALGIVFQLAEDFAAELDRLANETVTDEQWTAVLDRLVPVPTDEGRSRTIAENKRDAVVNLWHNDVRVTPWKGTALGVLQAFNTYAHHFGTVRNVTRPERNFANVLDGTTAQADALVLATVADVLAVA